MPTFGAAGQQDWMEHSPNHTHRVTPIPPGPGEGLPEIAGGASNAQSTGQIGFREEGQRGGSGQRIDVQLVLCRIRCCRKL